MSDTTKYEDILRLQQELCKKFGSAMVLPDWDSKIGLAMDSLGEMPITGVRTLPENGTDGWYIWGGEYSSDPDFYQPVHLRHLIDILPQVLPYLALAPGHKFIIDNEGYEDVWYEPELLEKPQ